MKTIEAIKFDIQQIVNSVKYMLFRRNLTRMNENVFVSAIYTCAGAIRLNTRGQRWLAKM